MIINILTLFRSVVAVLGQVTLGWGSWENYAFIERTNFVQMNDKDIPDN
jgi:hypothetical protein